MFSITKKNETRIASVFSHKLADIPNGVTVSGADMTQAVLYEGTPMGVDANGLYHIVKTAKVMVAATSTDTVITVAKGHNFKVGNIVFAVAGGKAYDITAIATNASNSEYDDITVSTTLGVALAVGAVIMEAASTGATKGAFKYAPVACVGNNYDVESLSNTTVDAITIGQAFESRLDVAVGDVLKAALTTIKFI